MCVLYIDCIYVGHVNINKGEIRGPGQGNGQFQFVLQIFARPPLPPRENLKNKLKLTISVKDLGPTYPINHLMEQIKHELKIKYRIEIQNKNIK